MSAAAQERTCATCAWRVGFGSDPQQAGCYHCVDEAVREMSPSTGQIVWLWETCDLHETPDERAARQLAGTDQ